MRPHFLCVRYAQTQSAHVSITHNANVLTVLRQNARCALSFHGGGGWGHNDTPVPVVEKAVGNL